MATIDESNIDEHDEEVDEDFEDFEGDELATSSALADAVTQITERVLDIIEGASAIREGFFFHNGIDLIEVSVNIAGVKAAVKIAGPKSA